MWSMYSSSCHVAPCMGYSMVHAVPTLHASQCTLYSPPHTAPQCTVIHEPEVPRYATLYVQAERGRGSGVGGEAFLHFLLSSTLLYL